MNRILTMLLIPFFMLGTTAPPESVPPDYLITEITVTCPEDSPASRQFSDTQSIKIILPPMVNQVVNLVKNTSCLYIIGGTDLISLTYNFVTGASTGGAYGPAYLVCGLLFFVFCYPLSKLASNWENNLKKRDRMSSTAK